MIKSAKQKFDDKDLEEIIKEKESLLKEGQVLHKRMSDFLDKQKILKIKHFISKQKNN